MDDLGSAGSETRTCANQSCFRDDGSGNVLTASQSRWFRSAEKYEPVEDRRGGDSEEDSDTGPNAGDDSRKQYGDEPGRGVEQRTASLPDRERKSTHDVDVPGLDGTVRRAPAYGSSPASPRSHDGRHQG